MCHVNQYLICTNFRHLNVTRNTLLRNCYQIKDLLSTCLICCWFKPKSLTNAFSGSKVILLVFARLILGKFKPMSHLEHKYLDKNICVDQERILSAGPHLVILTRPELPKSLHFVPTSPISPICISPRIIIIDANKIQSRYNLNAPEHISRKAKKLKIRKHPNIPTNVAFESRVWEHLEDTSMQGAHQQVIV